MENLNLIPFTKAWNYEDKRFGSKPYFFNPSLPFEGLEACYLKDGDKQIECTKIYYQTKFITLIGSPESFFKTCREANIALCLLTDLYKEGITIKQFMEQTGKLNDVNLV